MWEIGMEKTGKILESIKLVKNMIAFNSEALDSIHKIYFNWSNLFGTEENWDDAEYAFLFYCIDFFDETLINVGESKLPPLSREEKMKLFYDKGKGEVIETGKNILLRLEELLQQQLNNRG